MAVMLPNGFREVEKNDKGILKKGDEIVFVTKRPGWLPKNNPNLYEGIVKLKPAARDIITSVGGKQHSLSLCRVWTTEKELYTVYVVTVNPIPLFLIGLIIFAVGVGVGFLAHDIIKVGVKAAVSSGISTLVILAVLGLGGYLLVKYLLRRFG